MVSSFHHPEFRMLRRLHPGLALFAIFVTTCAADTAHPEWNWRSEPLYPLLHKHPAPARDRNVSCPEAPPAIQDIQTVSKYGEARSTNNSSIVDEDAERQYREDMKPIEAFSNEIVKRANHFVEGDETGKADAACALAWLDSWARGGAFLGAVNRQGQSVRKWELATFATTFIKIANAPDLDPEQRERVRDWIHAVAIEAQRDFSTGTELRSRQNNHLYWAAWGVTAAGIATGDRTLFDWGIDKYRFAIREIQDDGTLKLELDRRTRAAIYHMYALQPLIMIAEAGEVNGIPLYAEDGGRLQKLIDLNIAALDDISVIGRLNGFDQENLYTESVLSWIEPYYARFKDPRVEKWLDRYRPMSTRRTGGDMTALYAPAP